MKQFTSSSVGGGDKREVSQQYSPSQYGSIYDSADDGNASAPLLSARRSSLKVGSRSARKASQDEANSSGSGSASQQSQEVFDANEKLLNRSLRTGRQRKKLAARSKGGEFQARRRKRRVYFCCICSEIDIPKMHEYLTGAEELFFKGWESNVYGDLLHMFKPGLQEDRDRDRVDLGLTAQVPIMRSQSLQDSALSASNRGYGDMNANLDRQQQGSYDGPGAGTSLERLHSAQTDDDVACASDGELLDIDNYGRGRVLSQDLDRDQNIEIDRAVDMNREGHDGRGSTAGAHSRSQEDGIRDRDQSGFTDGAKPKSCRISAVGAQEVFVFDFGAAVFWGFSRGEEARIIKAIRMFVTKGMVVGAEFESGEDDMAFVTLPEADAISVSNDVITLPETSTVKQRLSVSFAIAQSTVLAIFESRIESKIEEYKYIPETLAACGKVQLSQRQLGVMIGEVFVIRHDVNLHSEILDTPDFFWKEEKCKIVIELLLLLSCFFSCWFVSI